MSASEAVPALDGGSFYAGPEASARIMRAAHFPDELLSLLQLEGVTLFNALVRYRCDTLVELGCYDGRALEISRLAGVRYLGIDLDAAAIAQLRARIRAEAMTASADAVVADALEVGRWAPRVPPGRTLVYLPFNLLGTFRDAAPLLRDLNTVPGALVLVCMFNVDPLATLVRQTYYDACGVTGLRVSVDVSGVVTFTGHNRFHSRAFTREQLGELLSRCGRSVLWETANRIGFCVVTR